MVRKKEMLITFFTILIVLFVFSVIYIRSGCNNDNEHDKTKANIAKANVRTIYNAIERFKLKDQSENYPETLQELVTGPVGFAGQWKSLLHCGERSLKDPWGNEYVMDEDKDGHIVVICLGADGEEGPGTKEYDADIRYPSIFEE